MKKKDVYPYFPLYPKGYRNKFKQCEMDCLTWFVLTGCEKETAYKTFVHPEIVSENVIARLAKEFFGSKDTLQYLSDYRDMLQSAISKANFAENMLSGGTPKLSQKREDETESEYQERRKQESLAFLYDYINDNIMKIDGDNELLKQLVDIMNKIGYLDDIASTAKPPIRYLPETCSQCRYRIYVEEVESANSEANEAEQ